MKKMFFAAIAVCAFSTATFAGEVKEVKAEIKEVSVKVEVLKGDCDAGWIATYHEIYTSTGDRDLAIAAADAGERACKGLSSVQ